MSSSNESIKLCGIYLRIWICVCVVISAEGLNCIQCNTIERAQRLDANRNGNKVDMTDCYEGRIEPRLCPNPNHTHCITYYFTDMTTRAMMVLWRKCGFQTDAQHPCQVHDLGSESVVDLYGGAPGSYKQVRFRPKNQSSIERVSSHRRRSLVQVCVAGCKEDGCLAAAGVSFRSGLRLMSYVLFGFVARWLL